MVTIKFVFKFYYCLHQVTPLLFTVGVKHPKTASNLLKPMKRSNIITKNSKPQKSQELLKELLKKEHPKTSTKLPKFIKKKQKLLLNNQRKQKFQPLTATIATIRHY